MSEEDEVVLMLQDCMKRWDKLTEWEQGFMLSIEEWLPTSRLTDRQLQRLEIIWERVTE